MNQEEFFKKLENDEFVGEDYPKKAMELIHILHNVKDNLVYNVNNLNEAKNLEKSIECVKPYFATMIHKNKTRENAYQIGVYRRTNLTKNLD